MSEQDLYNRLMIDLEKLHLPVDDIELVVRPYCKSFYGRYFPVDKTKKTKKEVKPRIFIYPYPCKHLKCMFSYSSILCTVIHEMCHHLQFTSSNYRRLKGVMHDPQFWILYNRYANKAVEMRIIKGRIDR